MRTHTQTHTNKALSQQPSRNMGSSQKKEKKQKEKKQSLDICTFIQWKWYCKNSTKPMEKNLQKSNVSLTFHTKIQL